MAKLIRRVSEKKPETLHDDISNLRGNFYRLDSKPNEIYRLLYFWCQEGGDGKPYFDAEILDLKGKIYRCNEYTPYSPKTIQKSG